MTTSTATHLWRDTGIFVENGKEGHPPALIVDHIAIVAMDAATARRYEAKVSEWADATRAYYKGRT